MIKSLTLGILSSFLYFGSALYAQNDNDNEVERPRRSYEDLRPQEQRVYDRGRITSGQALGGGLIGTVVGFGSGHVVINAYRDMGWVFTVGELGSVGLAAAGVLSDGKGNAGGLMLAGGILSFLGFRVWQIVDVWTRPEKMREDYYRIERKLSSFELAPVLATERWGVEARLRF